MMQRCNHCGGENSQLAKFCQSCGTPRGTPPPSFAGQGAGSPGMGKEPILIHEPGGDILRQFVHPEAFTIYEQEYRTLPEDSWFDPNVSPKRPVQFELGAFEVPKNQHLWLFDYEFSVFRLSGVDAGDIVQAENGRYSGVMGFDLNFSGKRLTNILFQLDPIPSVLARPTFNPPTGGRAVPSQFNQAAAQSFAANSSQGLSLLPVRSNKMGARGAPFTLVAREGDRVSMNCVIFKPIPSPIAAVQARSAGYLIHSQISNTLINRLRPR